MVKGREWFFLFRVSRVRFAENYEVLARIISTARQQKVTSYKCISRGETKGRTHHGLVARTIAGRKVDLGDEPCDLVLDALEAISRSYREDLGRKPMLEEFRILLLRALAGDPGRYFSDMEEHIVGDVVFRRKKVPKRQTSAVGDYFAIPLDGKFWFGRIIHGKGDLLAEIYSIESNWLLSMRQLLRQKRKVVLYKHVFETPCFTRARWRIIGHEDMPKEFKYPSFYGGLMAYGNYTVWRGDGTFYEPKAKAMKYEPKQIWGPERIEEALRAGEFGEWPEVTSSKKDTFDNHEKKLKFLHEYFDIPMRKKRK